jgi:alkanesulfonate monooxygenase SsuD/methylene tetrahydromethanopterin reductase-like flavin-dependent oxidoreductase (luciferase family)
LVNTIEHVTDAPEPHPWVAAGNQTIRFGIDLWPQPDLPALIPQVQRIERLGFDAYWKEDHPVFGPDVWLTLAVLARATTTIRLASFVSCVYYRHPVVLARMARDVDDLSDGRLILVLGIGVSEQEFTHLGLPFPPVAERHKVLVETVQVVRDMWTGQPNSFRGQTFSAYEIPACPVPPQRPRVPILIAGGGEQVTLRLVERHADAPNFGPLRATGSAVTFDDVRRKLTALRQHCEQRGRS